jgi:hypothetical protein
MILKGMRSFNLSRNTNKMSRHGTCPKRVEKSDKTGNKVLLRDILLVFLDKLIHDARNTEHKMRSFSAEFSKHATILDHKTEFA